MIALGRVVEEIVREPLADHLRKTVFEPLKMKDTGYWPDKTRCAPTSKDDPGTVHDPLAQKYMSKEHQSGNAGLFSTGDDLAIFLRTLLDGKILKPKTVEEMFAPNSDTRGLGWDVFDDPPFKPGVGHTGYTGTLLWMNPATGKFCVLLTNRVYPDDKSNVTRLRKEVLQSINR